MDISQQKEQFSVAYIRAVASVAGFSLSAPEVDDDSVDFTIAKTGGGGTIRSPKLDLQLKCASRTSDGVRIGTSEIGYRLKVKNYNDLRVDAYLVPRILVLVLVNENDVANWLNESEDKLLLNSSGYWLSLKGMPSPGVTGDKVKIKVPRAQLFDVEQVSQLLANIENGGTV